jgi:uracil-DNA glycosylase
LFSDLTGRVLTVKDDLSLELTEKGRILDLGRIQTEPDGSVSYYKKEKEENIFRKYNAWTVLEIIGTRVNKIIYETDTTVYTLTGIKTMNCKIWGIHELDRKLVIPLDLWRKEYKNTKMQRRLELFGHEWYGLLREHIDSDWFSEIGKYVAQRRKQTVVFPDKDRVFRVFGLEPEKVKVLVLGQDPYYNSLADGLAFSSNNPEVVPESLKNIFKEIESSLDTLILDPDPSLDRWHEQGVFLLNTCLTVEAGVPLSHSKIGWERFTTEVVRTINTFEKPVVYLLWGNHARGFAKYITNPMHKVIETVHPSPLSAHRGFLGSGCFVQCNEYLKQHGLTEIDWR